MQIQEFTCKNQTEMLAENSYPTAPKLKPLVMNQQFDQISLDDNTLPSLDEMSFSSPHSETSQEIEVFEQRGPKRGYSDFIKDHMPCGGIISQMITLAPRRVRKVVHYDTNYKFQ